MKEDYAECLLWNTKRLGRRRNKGVQMMATFVKVRVTWCSEKMKHLPSSRSYSTVAKFAEDAEHWPDTAWSIVLDFSSSVVAHAESFEATARFLVPDAPWERLRSGCVFELYEGFKKAASVTVL
ncbi:hypothetical protein [Paraherbaspirillum soli]|uniref:Uncharacterized protein n=1 Tax=Paraherbaspirillum soli TaxID=631222 RepID=A0ABW0M8N8_9BURK